MAKSSAAAKPGLSKQRVAECYKRGVQLSTNDKNYDYAHAMFAQCVLNDPGNLQYVEALVRNLRELVPFVRKWQMPHLGGHPLKKELRQENWQAVLCRGIELLRKNPWDVPTLRAMAEASAALHYNEAELVYLKQALDAAPKSIEVNTHCGQSLRRMGQYDQAVACWRRVQILKGKGKDQEATKMISLLAEEKILFPNGRPSVAKPKEDRVEQVEQESSEDAPPVKPKKTLVQPSPAVKQASAKRKKKLKGEAATKKVKLDPRQSLEHAISQEPENARNYVQLSELLVDAGQVNTAEAWLVKANDVCSDKEGLVEQLNRVRSLRGEDAEEEQVVTGDQANDLEVSGAKPSFPWLELALALSVIFLVLEIFPSAGRVVWETLVASEAAVWRKVQSVGGAIWSVLDVREWTQLSWFVANIIVIVALFGFRFVSERRRDGC